MRLRTLLVLFPPSSFHNSQLLNISQKFTDYHADDEVMADTDTERRNPEIDHEVGVAVMFDKEEKEEGQ